MSTNVYNFLQLDETLLLIEIHNTRLKAYYGIPFYIQSSGIRFLMKREVQTEPNETHREWKCCYGNYDDLNEMWSLCQSQAMRLQKGKHTATLQRLDHGLSALEEILMSL
jgi:hypothetical protein